MMRIRGYSMLERWAHCCSIFEKQVSRLAKEWQLHPFFLLSTETSREGDGVSSTSIGKERLRNRRSVLQEISNLTGLHATCIAIDHQHVSRAFDLPCFALL